MRCHIYFLQYEYDAVRFLDALSELRAIVWTGSALKSPLELKDEIKNQMSSFFCRYTIIPQAEMDTLRLNGSDTSLDMIGIEFLVCCKRNALSRTYEEGRIYYKEDENNKCSEQMLLLYKQLKKFISTNYSFSKKTGIYIAPHFKQKYEENYLHATQLGRPITL